MLPYFPLQGLPLDRVGPSCTGVHPSETKRRRAESVDGKSQVASSTLESRIRLGCNSTPPSSSYTHETLAPYLDNGGSRS